MIAGLSLTTLLLILLAGVGAGFVGYAVGASSLAENLPDRRAGVVAGHPRRRPGAQDVLTVPIRS